MSSTFEHISAFQSAPEETQIRVMVEYILETHFFGEQEIRKLENRIFKFAEKKGIPYHKAATIVRERARQSIEIRLEQVV